MKGGQYFQKKNDLKLTTIPPKSEFRLPYYPAYKAMALYPIQGHPWPYNEYKAMVLYNSNFPLFSASKSTDPLLYKAIYVLI